MINKTIEKGRINAWTVFQIILDLKPNVHNKGYVPCGFLYVSMAIAPPEFTVPGTGIRPAIPHGT